METKTAQKMFIDLEDMAISRKVFRRLKRLKSVISIDKPINYYFGGIQHECIILLETTMSETELDNWLYRTNFNSYSSPIGCGASHV